MCKRDIEDIGREIIDSAFQVHNALGPGLLESAYEHCLFFELSSRNIPVTRQTVLPITYKGMKIDAGFRLDLLVDDSVIVEIKAVESMLPIYQAQILTYLRQSGCHLGFLINFNVKMFKDGVRRVVM